MAIDTTRALIATIRNASQVGENTATRVGDTLDAMLDDVKQNADDISDLDTDVSTAEANIANLQGRMATAENTNAVQNVNIQGLQHALQNVQQVTINGNVTNNPDEVFLTSTNDKVTPKTRTTANAEKGYFAYKPLGQNETFAQFLVQNTIHEICFDMDLGGASVTIPSGAILKFNGGKLMNGTLLGDITIDAPNVQIFSGVTIGGKLNFVNATWFGAKPCEDITNPVSSSAAFQTILDAGFTDIYLPTGLYYFDEAVNVTHAMDLKMEGFVPHYNYNVSNPVPNAAYIFTDQDITLFKVYDQRFPISITGGALDVSLCSSYTSSVINIGDDQVVRISRCLIETTIIGHPITAGFCGTGKAVNISMVNIGNCAATFINIRSFIYAFEYGVYVKALDENLHWITNFTDESLIYHCKTHIYCDTAYMCKILGSYQCGNIGAAGHSDTTPAIYIKGHDYDINARLWDVNGSSSSGASNKVSIEFAPECYRVDVGDISMRDNTYFVGYDSINNHNNIKHLPRFINDLYSFGYNELYNWFVNRDEFSASVSNIVGCSVGSSWVKDLFNPTALLDASHTVGITDANTAELTVNVTLATAQQLTMLGCLTSINDDGSFGSIDVTVTYSNNTTESRTFDVESYDSALYAYVYFGKFRFASKGKVSSFAIRFYNYRGTSSTKILSVFGAIRGKTLSFLSAAGGRISGGNIANKSGDLIFAEPTTNGALSVASWAVGALNFLTDKLGFAVKVDTSNNVRYLTPLLAAKNGSGSRPDVNGIGFQVVDASTGEVYFWDGSAWIDSLGYPSNTARYGATANRPDAAVVGGKPGYIYFDTTTKTPTFVAGTGLWVNYDGSRAGSARNGYENSAPLPNSFWNTPIGFVYMCLGTVKKPLFMHSVDSSGNNVWVDAQGNAKGTKYYGATTDRPSAPLTGTMFFDTTLGYPVWYNGSGWVKYDGTTA